MKFSIVIPSFNQAAFLQRTLSSVLDQQGPFDLQVIVMDGGSSDGTVDLLKSIDDPRLEWLSERDNGQSDAINKGMARTAGDVVAWVNSDDLYLPGALTAVAEAFEKHPQAQWVVGGCRIIDENDREIRQWVTRHKSRSLRRYSYARLLRENFISQMSVFWRRSFGKQIGTVDESLYYCMDYDLWLRMGRAGEPAILDQDLAAFRVHQSSKTNLDHRAQFKEQFSVVGRYAGGDRISLLMQRVNICKALCGYRLLRLIGR